MLRVFTDSSYDNRYGIAGIGCVIIENQKRRVYSNWVKVSNNNIGELYALWFALNIIQGKDAEIYTDSTTALSYIADEIKEKPLTPQRLKNRIELKKWGYRIRQITSPLTTFQHVKAHTNFCDEKYQQQSLADALAKEGVKKFFYSLKVKQNQR